MHTKSKLVSSHKLHFQVKMYLTFRLPNNLRVSCFLRFLGINRYSLRANTMFNNNKFRHCPTPFLHSMYLFIHTVITSASVRCPSYFVYFNQIRRHRLSPRRRLRYLFLFQFIYHITFSWNSSELRSFFLTITLLQSKNIWLYSSLCCNAISCNNCEQRLDVKPCLQVYGSLCQSFRSISNVISVINRRY